MISILMTSFDSLDVGSVAASIRLFDQGWKTGGVICASVCAFSLGHTALPSATGIFDD